MEVQPISEKHSRFPPRGSSYSALSIIDAYGGDPGIQFSPVVDSIPRKEPLNSVRRLREEDSLSGYYSFDGDYGSELDPEKVMMMDADEYDPFRQDVPVHTPRTPRSNKIGTPVLKVEAPPPVPKIEVERTRADSVLAKGMCLCLSSTSLREACMV